MRNRISGLVVILSFTLTYPILAQNDSTQQSRIWKSVTGNQMTGKYGGFRESLVVIEKEDGKKVGILLDKLSEEDKKYALEQNTKELDRQRQTKEEQQRKAKQRKEEVQQIITEEYARINARAEEAERQRQAVRQYESEQTAKGLVKYGGYWMTPEQAQRQYEAQVEARRVAFARLQAQQEENKKKRILEESEEKVEELSRKIQSMEMQATMGVSLYQPISRQSDLINTEQMKKDAEYKYKGDSGQKYKYDLSDPSDRMDYKYDWDAQWNDKWNSKFNFDVQMDQQNRQYGGGIKP